MSSLTNEQILVLSVLPIWFLFPLGILVSFIKQSNGAHPPKVSGQPYAEDVAQSAAYTSDEDDDDSDDEEFEPTPIPAYQIPKNDKNSNNYNPRV